MSAPGPLVVGIGLIIGKSSTQLADFVRRTSELVAIIVAYVIYRKTNRDGYCDPDRKEYLERVSNLVVGAMMCVAGSVMIFVSLTSGSSETGNVIPGLSIAVLGVIANTFFWIKYSKLNRENPNAIIAVQARLYRAKSLVDICVTLALLSCVLFPGTEFAHYLDLVGSLIVAAYLAWSGIKTIRERIRE